LANGLLGLAKNYSYCTILQEEDAKVMRGAYYYVRSGRVEKAVEFLFESGHVATAAMLNGFWYSEKMPLNLESDLTRGDITAYDDIESTNDAVNMNHTTNTSSPTSQTFGILGNAERDMWKCTAFEVCEMNGLSKYARAALGALCGHRKAILDVATNWEDKVEGDQDSRCIQFFFCILAGSDSDFAFHFSYGLT